MKRTGILFIYFILFYFICRTRMKQSCLAVEGQTTRDSIHGHAFVLRPRVRYRDRPNFGFSFGFGAEIGKKFSFCLVSFSVGRAAASFGFGRNCQ